MSKTRKTHSQYSAGITATMSGPSRSAGFNAATDKTLSVMHSGLTVEIYRRDDGDTQTNWFPARPNFKHRTVRDFVFPHYATAMQAYTNLFGAPGYIHGSAYEGGAKA